MSTIKDMDNKRVKMGAHNRVHKEYTQQVRKFKQIIKHRLHNEVSQYADIALIEVDKPFELNSRVVVACLPKSEIPVGTQNCYVAGK